MIRRLQFHSPLTTSASIHHRLFHSTTTHHSDCNTPSPISPATTPNPLTPVNPSHLLRVCTILYQQQDSSESKLHTSLSRCDFDLNHEFFLQICNKFPSSWKPVYKFHKFTQTKTFDHTPVTLNKCLISGFCDVGELVEATKIWNLMVDEGFEVEIDGVEKMMDTLFKTNRFNEAMKLFQSIDDVGLSSCRLVINWMCKMGKLGHARKVFDEMLERGIQPDCMILGSLIYGFLSKGRIREAYNIAELLGVGRSLEL